MTRFALILALALAASLAHALTLEEALASAPSRPEAVTAQLELLSAETELLRVQGDPLALRLDRVQAEQRVLSGEAELKRAFYQGLADIARAYTGVLEARARLELARAGQTLAESSLEIARIRVQNGSATALELREAEVGLEEAATNARAAESALALTENDLEGMIGQEVAAGELEPVPDSFLAPLPALETALEAAIEHPQRLEVVQGLELARLGLELLDPSYAPQSQLESARTRLESTERLAEEAERGFALQVRNLYLQAETAAESVQVARTSAANAQERLESEEARLQAGLVSEVQLEQARLAALQAELEALAARHAYFSALLALQQGAMVQLAGPEVLGYASVRERLNEGANDGE